MFRTIAQANGDRIYDFKSGLRTLEVNAIGFGGAAGAFDFKAGANPLAADADQAFLYDTDDGRLYFDADGNGAGAAVFVCRVFAVGGGVPTLAATDIDLI